MYDIGTSSGLSTRYSFDKAMDMARNRFLSWMKKVGNGFFDDKDYFPEQRYDLVSNLHASLFRQHLARRHTSVEKALRTAYDMKSPLEWSTILSVPQFNEKMERCVKKGMCSIFF